MEEKKGSIIFILVFALGSATADMEWKSMTIKAAAQERTTAVDLLETELYSLRYDVDKTVGDYVRAHFDVATQLSKLLHENQSMRQNYMTDGGIEYVYKLTITPDVLSLLLPTIEPVQLVVPMLCPCCGQEWPQGIPVPADQELVPQETEPTNYTGIVIDCRGFPLAPCLFPKIYNELNEEVYSVNFADVNHLLQNGLVLYTTADEYDNTRVGSNPLRVQAMGVFGKALTDIRLSSPDARRIHASKNNIQLLKECRVAIIIGL